MTHSRFRVAPHGGLLPAMLFALAACSPGSPAPAPSPVPARTATAQPAATSSAATMPMTRNAFLAHSIIPAPLMAQVNPAQSFSVDSTTAVVVDAGASAETRAVAEQLARMLAPVTTVGVRDAATAGSGRPIRLVIDAADAAGVALGDEGYELAIAANGVTLRAAQPAGLFHGLQTIRQLMPVSIEHPAALARRLRMPEAHIVDVPRFAWRGAMLDVSRHFLKPDAVRRYVDAMALYKMNRLHLHLADDQGWRIEILSRPELARHGGSTQVGGGPGGYYTQREYADLVAYAAARYVTIVPEIDMPGHTNAALASYAEINCDGVARPLFTGIAVGFSNVCVEREETYAFVDDVVREIAGLTPGPWFHIGGDEVQRLSNAQYRGFIERVQGIVTKHGKRMIGWGEIAPAALLQSTIVQHWKRDSSAVHAARGGSVILSPGPKMYLDMKYDSTTVLGLRWAGLIEVRDSYDWDPATYLAGLPTSAILGVEAPLWAETLERESDYQFLAFPRLLAVAETGWSTAQAHEWENFRNRLGAHGPRLRALGINFYPSPQIPWR